MLTDILKDNMFEDLDEVLPFTQLGMASIGINQLLNLAHYRFQQTGRGHHHIIVPNGSHKVVISCSP